MHKIIGRLAFTALFLIILVTSITTPVFAFDGRSGNSVTVASGETVNGDLYLAGGDLVVNGIVNGDVFGAGRSITIGGTVNGGITCAAQTIAVNGKIYSGARLAAQTITVGGAIGRDLVVFGSDVSIDRGAQIGGDLVIGVQTARVQGNISGGIRGSANEINIGGPVAGDVSVEVAGLTVASQADIRGKLVYTSKNEASIQAGSQVRGGVTHNIPEVKARRTVGWLAGAAVLWKVLGFVMILVIGIIVIVVAARRTTSMADSIRQRPWQSLGWGALILFVTPIAAIIVMCTLIGIPLGLIALVIYGIALYLSQIPVALLIGRLIIVQNREMKSTGLMIGALALGLIILSILKVIPVVGWIISLLVMLFGLGCLVTSMVKVKIESA